MSRVSLLFPARNRLEFTRESWHRLMDNTNWSAVSELHVYDDGSEDGTREWLTQQVQWKARHEERGATDVVMHNSRFLSPMGVTLDWIKCSSSPILAKIDNDAVYPPQWLDVALSVLDRNPDLEMLGIECMREPACWRDGQWRDGRYGYEIGGAAAVFGYLPAQYVSGLGLYRASAFDRGLPIDGGYFGLEEWQTANRVKAGWILPSLPVFLLDRLPFEPWKSLSEEYVRKGYQREWSGAGPLRYKHHQAAMWQWWIDQKCENHS